MPSLTSEPAAASEATPFELVAHSSPAARRTKRELLAASRLLERRLATREVTSVFVTFQHREHLTPLSREAYASFARRGVEVYAFARGLVSDYRPESWELRTVSLTSHDPLVSEWDIVVLGPGLTEAFVARDLTPGVEVVGKDLERPFSWTSTTDPDLVHAAASALRARVPVAAR